MRFPVYNLEFPPWCSEFTVQGHKFYRVEDYQQQVNKLSHFNAGSIGSEITIHPNTGEHTITAIVSVPFKKEKIKNGTMFLEFERILFLLSLLTGREVFSFREDYPSSRNWVIKYDSRQAPFGGILKVSVPHDLEKVSSLKFKEIKYERSINEIYQKISDENWLKQYGEGHFLYLAKNAFRASTYESAFVQCWTIWEHLFVLHNRDWLSASAINQLGSQEKISFILHRYFFKNEQLDSRSNSKIKELSEIRNRLVHFGKFPEKKEHIEFFGDVTLFIELTEQLIAKILGLSPSDVFNTMEKWKNFLKKKNQKA